jgi:ferredoxin-NADP reductase
LRIRLIERRPETADVMSFVFDRGGQPLEYLPGQHLTFRLDALSFPDRRGHRRHFTISSSPSEEGIVMFTTRMRGSGFKETLRHAPIGYELACGSPGGRFVLPGGETRRHVLIAGGIGVTPYRSILRHAADTGGRIEGVMLYHNRSQGEIVFREELEGIARQLATFSLVHVLDEPEPGWTGETGKPEDALIRRWVADPERSLFWLSGPPAFVGAYRELITKIGVRDGAVRTEGFIGY